MNNTQQPQQSVGQESKVVQPSTVQTPQPTQSPAVAPQAPSQTTPVAKAVSQGPTPTQGSEGFNLIPAMTEEEKVTIKAKNTLNIGSILSIIALASVALGIVGFNIISKAQLNSKKGALRKIENTVTSKMDKIVANNAIVDRVDLYMDNKSGSFSHKQIIMFLNEITATIPGMSLNTIDISENLGFEISGIGPNLESVAKLWYLFGVHENLKSINLESVSKGDMDSRFSFKGELEITNFKNE